MATLRQLEESSLDFYGSSFTDLILSGYSFTPRSYTSDDECYHGTMTYHKNHLNNSGMVYSVSLLADYGDWERADSKGSVNRSTEGSCKCTTASLLMSGCSCGHITRYRIEY